MLFFENLISSTFPFAFLMISGVCFSFKTRFSQITKFTDSLKITAKAFKYRKNSKEVTSFKSACTALSATVGTGNIAGVAGALSIGGAGAIFWMWISAILGMIIKALEINTSILYREKKDGNFVGGPMYSIKNGLGQKFKPLSFIFALAAIPAVLCSGNITQTNAALITFCKNDFSKILWGIIFATGVFLALKGGFNRIASLTERLVPLMSVLYIVLCGIVILNNFSALPGVFVLIFKGAFNPKAVTGGAVGSITICIFIGATRGIFSNESGLGTSGMAHSVAVDANPQTQGLFGIFEVFVDTILLCTLTALTILCSGVKINYGHIASTELVKISLSPTFGNFGSVLLSVMMCLFAFSSIIGWGVYGKLCSQFLFPKSGNTIFTMIYPPCCILGALFESSFAWRLAAFSNGIMLCINLTALLLLYEKSEVFFKKENLIKNEKGRKHKKYFTKPSSRIDFF